MKEDRQFDELVRNVMGNGTEEVPAGLWGAVESALPAGKAKVVPLWFKWTGAAVAAAAVAATVILTVVLPVGGADVNPVEIVNEGVRLAEKPEARAEDHGGLIAQALPSEVADSRDGMKMSAKAGFDVRQKEKMTEEGKAASEEDTAVTTSNTAGNTVGTVLPEEKTDAAETVTTSASGSEEKAPAEASTDDQVTDEADFDEGGRAVKERRASGFSLTLTGNATSNTNPKISGNTVRRSFRSANASAPAKSTVIQTDESVFGVPLAAGLGFRYNFNDRWSVGSGVNFTVLSRSFAGDYIRVGEDGVKESAEHYGNIRNNQVYFGVPVYAFCNIVTNRIIDFYAYAGGEMDKCIYNKYLLQSASGKFSHEERYKGLQWSVKAGLGVEFIVTEDLGIFVDPQVGWYFKNKAEYTNIWNYQPLMFGVNLGLRLRI